jgi:hypothetical protein
MALAEKLGVSIDENDVYIDNNFSCVTYPAGFERQAEADETYHELKKPCELETFD